MISNPRPNQPVRIHYATTPRRRGMIAPAWVITSKGRAAMVEIANGRKAS
jgi:hypothetical protein